MDEFVDSQIYNLNKLEIVFDYSTEESEPDYFTCCALKREKLSINVVEM